MAYIKASDICDGLVDCPGSNADEDPKLCAKYQRFVCNRSVFVCLVTRTPEDKKGEGAHRFKTFIFLLEKSTF